MQQHLEETLQDFAARWATAYGWRQIMQAKPPGVSLYEPEVRSFFRR